MGEHPYGIDRKTVAAIAEEIVGVQAEGSSSRSSSAAATSTAAWRRPRTAWTGRPPTTPGMLATVLNALALQDALERVGRRHARAVGARGLRGRGAVHPAARDAPSREGPRRDLRGRDRQPVLHDRHRRRAARARDRRRGDPDGQERDEGRLRRRSAARSERDVPAGAHAPRGDRARPARDGHDRALALHGERPADLRLRARGGQHPPRRARRARRHDHFQPPIDDDKES